MLTSRSTESKLSSAISASRSTASTERTSHSGGDRLAAADLDLGGGPARGHQVDVGGQHPGAASGQREAQLAADAPSGSGDDCAADRLSGHAAS